MLQENVCLLCFHSRIQHYWPIPLLFHFMQLTLIWEHFSEIQGSLLDREGCCVAHPLFDLHSKDRGILNYSTTMQ